MKLKQILLPIITLATILACSTSSKANSNEIESKTDSYEIKIKINGLKDSVAYLANYVGRNIFYYDTAIVKNGEFTFRKEKYPHGVYAIIASLKPKPIYFDILINEKNISLETDLDNIIPKMNVKVSEENKLFYNYINYLRIQSMKKNPLMSQRESLDKNLDKEKIKSIETKVKNIDSLVMKFQLDFVKKNQDKYVGKLMNMSVEIEIPDAPKEITDKEEINIWKYEYYKNHYLDKIDFKDERLGRSALFHNQISNYFMKVIPQIPDTINKRLTQYMNNLQPGGDMMKYSVEYLTYAHVKTKLMGMDAVYVHMADNYILNGKSEWIGKDKIEKIRPKVDKMRPTLLGKTAPNIILADTTEKNWKNLHEVKSDYTLLIFWSDDCGHCKREIPKYKKFYDSIKKATDVSFEIFAVCTHLENTGWRKFIKQHNLNWINVSDFPDLRDNYSKYIKRTTYVNGEKITTGFTDGKSINFRNSYDVFVTPVGYLLDKNKKIIAKQFEFEQLDGILKHNIEISK